MIDGALLELRYGEFDDGVSLPLIAPAIISRPTARRIACASAGESAVYSKKHRHISSVVCSPCVTRLGGLLGLLGLACELSYLASKRIVEPCGSVTGSA